LLDYEKISPNNLSEFRNVTSKFSKVMHNTISQLQSEFSEDIIKIDGTPDENCQNDLILDQIEDQVQHLGRKISELLNEINEMKSAPLTKPNDEIKFWKSKGAKLTKAFKLTQDERVKVLIVTLQKAINLGKRNSKTLDDFQKQLDELQREYTKIKEDENLVATLERHFNAIDSSVNRKGQSLSNFIEPISNLITHTKLIWMNTKHFHKDTARFKLLMDAVEREINS